MKLRILHTNDIHSRFENYGKIVTKIREMKNDDTIILDAGDFNDFMRIELEGTCGKAGVELLDAAGCSALAVGNNETFKGIDMLSDMAYAGSVSFLSCNLYKSDLSPILGLKPSIIIEKGGARVLIIGTSPLLGVFYEMMGMTTIDYKEAIKRELNENRGNYNISILLSHLGITEDRDIAGTMEGIDIIIDGHSHILMDEPEIIKNTIINQSGLYGEYLGVLDIEYDGGIRSYSGKNIKVEDLPCDIVIMDLINKNKEIAIDNLSEPLYYINRDLWHDIVEENPITNLLADGLRDVLGCDIGLINSGVLNGGIRRGPVSKKKLLEVCPSPLNPTSFEIQGKFLRQALESSMYTDFCMQDGKGSGFRGKYLGRLHVSGAVIEHDRRRIQKVLICGNELEEEKWYSVASSDYLERGTGYESLLNNCNVRYNEEYLRDTLKDYLTKESFIDNAFCDRWIKI